MKVKFNGIMEYRKKGCGVCGKRAQGKTSFVTSKTYILPSGRSKTFTVNRVEEVSEMDGKFLLSYMVKDQNGSRAIFEEVK